MYDCVIVGGGAIGLSLAYDLVGHGLRVRVLDRGQPGREASWAGAGILPPPVRQNAQDPLDQLRALSSQRHERWAAQLREETGVDTGFRRCGGVYLARSAGEHALLAGMMSVWSEQGIRAERIDRETLCEMEPGLRGPHLAERFKSAYLIPDEIQIRNPWHMRALLQACELRGVEVSGQCGVTSFERAEGRIAAVQTENESITAKQFCIAAGPWTRRLLATLGIANGVEPYRGQIVLFRCEKPPLTRVINEGPRYLVPRDDGRVLAGSTVEEVGFETGNTPEAVGELTAFAHELCPALAPAPVEKTWSGLRPGTQDGYPYIGKAPGWENLFVAAGHFRSGLHLSTGTAVVLGRLMRGESPEMDLFPFRVGRG